MDGGEDRLRRAPGRALALGDVHVATEATREGDAPAGEGDATGDVDQVAGLHDQVEVAGAEQGHVDVDAGGVCSLLMTLVTHRDPLDDPVNTRCAR